MATEPKPVVDKADLGAKCRQLRQEFASNHDLTKSLQDAGIQADIWLAFWQADDLHALDINTIEVVVRQCEVWLQGQVQDDQQRQLAECLVKAVQGVGSCHNELQVKGDGE